MAIITKTIAYYSCDRCRFQEQETEKGCPAGWRHLTTLIPGQEKPPELEALICPACNDWLRLQFYSICLQERQGGNEFKTESRERTPSPLAPISEPEPSAKKPEPNLSEGTPSPLAPMSEKQNPPSVDPIRRLFRPGEEGLEPDRPENLPSLRSYVTKPSTIDSLRKFIHQG